MIRAFYTGGSGMISQQIRLDAHASNIANIHTTGFKGSRVTLSDKPYVPIRPAPADTPDLQTGQGVRAAAALRDLTQGPVVETGRKLDLAIDGPGFFRVRSGGETYYTRSGSFQISLEDGSAYAVTARGDYLLDAFGEPIIINDSMDTLPRKAGLVTFANPNGLSAAGGGRYAETAASGPARPLFGATIRQGYLEGANIRLAEEMAAIIQTQRAFQLNARMVQTADAMAQTVNNLRA